MEFVQSFRGKVLLVFEGFFYSEHSTMKNGAKKIQVKREKTCKSIGVLNEGQIKLTIEHNHLKKVLSYQFSASYRDLDSRYVSIVQPLM